MSGKVLIFLFNRGFKPGESFINRFRFKPNAPMLAFLYYRMSNFDQVYLEDCMQKYFYAIKEFTRAGVYCPGYKTEDRIFWLFPIVVPNKDLFV